MLPALVRHVFISTPRRPNFPFNTYHQNEKEATWAKKMRNMKCVGQSDHWIKFTISWTKVPQYSGLPLSHKRSCPSIWITLWLVGKACTTIYPSQRTQRDYSRHFITQYCTKPFVNQWEAKPKPITACIHALILSASNVGIGPIAIRGIALVWINNINWKSL